MRRMKTIIDWKQKKSKKNSNSIWFCHVICFFTILSHSLIHSYLCVCEIFNLAFGDLVFYFNIGYSYTFYSTLFLLILPIFILYCSLDSMIHFFFHFDFLFSCCILSGVVYMFLMLVSVVYFLSFVFLTFFSVEKQKQYQMKDKTDKKEERKNCESHERDTLWQ